MMLFRVCRQGSAGINLISIAVAMLLYGIGTNGPVSAHGPINTGPVILSVDQYPPVEEDIQRLSVFGVAAQQAGQRLVERGREILPDAHAVLSGPDTSMQLKLQLITVLGEIGAPESTKIILDLAEQYGANRYLQQNAFLALAKLPGHADAAALADRQLEFINNDPLVQRSAIAYLSKHPTADTQQWVDRYAVPGANPDVRYAAVYLGGVLGDERVQDWALELLQQRQTSSREYYPLMGLANITPPAELEELLGGLAISKQNREAALKHSQLKFGNTTTQRNAAEALLKSKNVWQRDDAIKYLVDSEKVEPLVGYWQQGDPFVRAAVKRAGFEIQTNESGAYLQPLSVPKDNSMQWFALAALLLIIIVVVYASRRRRGVIGQ